MIGALLLFSGCGGEEESSANNTIVQATTTDSVTATLVEVNSAPKAEAGEDQTVMINTLVTLSALGSTDADNDTLTYQWQVSTPSQQKVSIENGNSAKASFIANTQETYTAKLLVSDGKSSGEDSMQVLVSYTDEQVKLYLDPVNGSLNNDGSINAPLPSLQSVLASDKVFEDDVHIVLREGFHGKISLKDLNPQTKLTFIAYENEVPIFSELEISHSTKLVFEGITVDGSFSNLTRDNFMVRSDVHSQILSFNKMKIQSAKDSSTWRKADWYAHSIGGMDMRGQEISITNSLITNVYHAVSLRGNRAYYAHNIIDNFAGDGIRGLGDDSIYEYNTVRDCYIDDYNIQHDDGFQAFRTAQDGNYKIKNVTLRGNKILLFEDPITDFVRDNNLIGTLMQGLIITDGHADSWLVENNLIVSAQYHGISLYGATRCRVQNNTVISHPDLPKDKAPRIYLDDQKKSGQTHSNTENVIRNNITTTLTTWTFDASSKVENNIDIVESKVANFTNHFLDYAGHDFHLKQSSLAVDAGINTDLSEYDLDEKARVYHNAVDLGAYEYAQ